MSALNPSAVASMPTTMMSLPGLRPAALIAWIAPIASSSSWAKTPWMFLVFLSMAVMTDLDWDTLQLPLWLKPAGIVMPQPPILSRKPSPRSMPIVSPTAPVISTTLCLSAGKPARRPHIAVAAFWPSATKSGPTYVVYRLGSESIGRSSMTTTLPAALACLRTAS